MTSPEQPDTDEADIPEQFRIRQAKRERLLAEGREPYPAEVGRTHTLAEIRAAHRALPLYTETAAIIGLPGPAFLTRNTCHRFFATLPPEPAAA